MNDTSGPTSSRHQATAVRLQPQKTNTSSLLDKTWNNEPQKQLNRTEWLDNSIKPGESSTATSIRANILVNKPKNGYGRNVLLESGSHEVHRPILNKKNIAQQATWTGVTHDSKPYKPKKKEKVAKKQVVAKN